MPVAAITRECLAMFRSEAADLELVRRSRDSASAEDGEPAGMREALAVELEDEAGEPGQRLSAKHGFVEAAGLKTIGRDLALVAEAAGVDDALVNAILALPRKR